MCVCLISVNVFPIRVKVKMQNNPSPQLPCKGILKTSRSFDKSGAR